VLLKHNIIKPLVEFQLAKRLRQGLYNAIGMAAPRFLMSVRREFSFRVRLLVGLLALLQLIAPTWHVCELGGNTCCPPQNGAAKVQCHLPPEAEASPQTFIGAIPDAHAEHCLAKLLLGMPWQAVLPEQAALLRLRQAGSTPAAPRLVSLAGLPQPPSRGPPIFST
jgi:hypothetical protein